MWIWLENFLDKIDFLVKVQHSSLFWATSESQTQFNSFT